MWKVLYEIQNQHWIINLFIHLRKEFIDLYENVYYNMIFFKDSIILAESSI